MWKRPNPEKVTHSEVSINRRDRTIRDLVEELASGTQELKSLLYPEGKDEHPKPA
jgi:hypothetical protein